MKIVLLSRSCCTKGDERLSRGEELNGRLLRARCVHLADPRRGAAAAAAAARAAGERAEALEASTRRFRSAPEGSHPGRQSAPAPARAGAKARAAPHDAALP